MSDNVAPEAFSQEAIENIQTLRKAIVQVAVDSKYDFDTVFNAMSQALVGFTFDLLLATSGEVRPENLAELLESCHNNNLRVAEYAYNSLREEIAQQQPSDVDVITSAEVSAENQ